MFFGFPPFFDRLKHIVGPVLGLINLKMGDEIMKSLMKLIISLTVAVLFVSCSDDDGGNGSTGSLTVSSAAFSSGSDIPVQNTCDGVNDSPPIQWTGIPEGTQTLAMIMDDPDAPGGTFVHWVLFNIPGTVNSLAEAACPNGVLPTGCLRGENDFGTQGYSGPCPPTGSNHRYFFKIYALDSTLSLSAGATKAELVGAMSGHILEEAELMGRFSR